MPRTREAAGEYLPLIDQNGPLFASYQGKRITRFGIFERVRLLGKQVGIENLSPHDLRHFWTIDAFRNGNGIDLIQRYGGWNSAAMPLHYAKQVGIANKGLKISQ
jgi:integrase